MMSPAALLRGRWLIPAVSGGLIVTSWVLTYLTEGSGWAGAAMIAAAVVAGAPIVMKAISALGARVFGIDLLVSVAALGAIAIGNYWEAAAVTFLFAVGHALETATLAKTRSALAELLAVAPDVAIVLRGGQQVEVPAASVAEGELVLVKNGAKVPVDGVVTHGTGAIDEASITGESLPVEMQVGDQVFAGTVSLGGLLQVRATGVGANTTLARIIHRVEEAQDAKARAQSFMDRFSRWYTPAIVLLAVIGGLTTSNIDLALTLLVIGCPGALVISIPVSIVAGIGRGARDGMLIKGGEFLETAARIDVVALDKTGTLTEGKPHVTAVVPLDDEFTADDVVRLAARAEIGSEHPLAQPILDAAIHAGISITGLPEHTEPVVGRGIIATVAGDRIAVGNLKLLSAEGASSGELAAASTVVDQHAAAGQTPMIVARNGTPVGVIAVADRVRADAADMVDLLYRSGVKNVLMLTGDVAPVAQAVADQVGIDQLHAGLLPEDKLTIVSDLQQRGHTVAMVGDGVNDAPALAAADIGVAMGVAGTGVAIETADIALMREDLVTLPQAIRLARRTVNNMRQNIAIALTTVVLLLAGVFAGGVTMSLGMLVHEASVLVVIANAMRLMRPMTPPAPHDSTQQMPRTPSPRDTVLV